MDSAVHISEGKRQLGATSHHLQILEGQGRIPSVRRDFNERVYSNFDVTLLKGMGVGSRSRKAKRPEETLCG